MTSNSFSIFREFANQHALAASALQSFDPEDYIAFAANAPKEIVDFYSACDGGVVEGRNGCRFVFFPVTRIVPARLEIYGLDAAAYGVPWAMAFCQYSDSDILAYDSRLNKNSENAAIYDCWHESFADELSPPVIARSLCELISRFLEGGVASYWLSKVDQAVPDRSSDEAGK